MNLDAYLARIGVTRAAVAEPTLDTLATVAWAHVSSIPFENLEILLGRGVSIDLPDIEAKLVAGRRGGYCFEHNTLLTAALRALGFTVTNHLARVRWNGTALTPRTHMLLSVASPGSAGARSVIDGHLVDCGFGGQCPTAPIPLRHDEVFPQRHDRLRLVREGDEHVLQLAIMDGWEDLYAFTLEPQHAIDFEVANHYTATHPRSHFRVGPRVARTTADGRITLRDGELAFRRGGEVTRRTVTDPDELLAILDADFGLAFPPGTRFAGAHEERVGG